MASIQHILDCSMKSKRDRSHLQEHICSSPPMTCYSCVLIKDIPKPIFLWLSWPVQVSLHVHFCKVRAPPLQALIRFTRAFSVFGFSSRWLGLEFLSFELLRVLLIVQSSLSGTSLEWWLWSLNDQPMGPFDQQSAATSNSKETNDVLTITCETKY